MNTPVENGGSKPRLALHWQILIGMVAGLLFGWVATTLGGQQFTIDWVKPFGTIFIRLLKMIAIPLIVASLIKGVSDLQDLSRLSSMGFQTIGLYLMTTVIAVVIGLVIVNVFQPGRSVSDETRAGLLAAIPSDEKAADGSTTDASSEKLGKIQAQAKKQRSSGPLQPLVDMVPDNIFQASSNNGSMLQVIFFAIFFGVGLILIDSASAAPVKAVFDGFNEVILKLIDLIMLAAPVGVFALLATLVVESPGVDILMALVQYGFCVVAGLALMMLVVYPGLVWLITGKSPRFFFKGILPAQLLAFSTSSSAATLPVTMERVEEHLGVHREVSSFVLPIGATVNMDGTSLYQSVAAVFIAQVLGIDLDLQQQLTIVMTASLASIGSAAVPGAGMVMLVIVLEAIEVPSAGLALIFAIDRPLDMCRTAVNVTGDATVAMAVAKRVGRLDKPVEKNWDDNYPTDEEAVGEESDK
ncbi:dicarboxylate/amino acid:cation symporter [Mariniblastus sp.]|nr:dicarboxylate/amino acid:cation symporter [Mariniblastus sp.]